jgi:hypothetical protein
LASVGIGAFLNCSALSQITIRDGMADLPLYFLEETTGAPLVKIYVPPSVISVGGAGNFVTTPPAGAVLSYSNLITGVKGSFIAGWARQNNLQFLEVDGAAAQTGYNDFD